MRRLCCHPAVASQWNDRLVTERGGGAGGGGGGGGGRGGDGGSGVFPLLSLDQMRERMLGWKRDEIKAAHVTLARETRNGEAARQAAALVLDARPHLANAAGAECAAAADEPGVSLWRCITADRGAYPTAVYAALVDAVRCAIAPAVPTANRSTVKYAIDSPIDAAHKSAK